MKKRMLGLLTALALCLSLLPGTALAEDGPVTITKANGSSPVTMEAGKKYKTWSGQFGGGIEEVADQENPGDIYLVYADGVLTAHGNDYSGYPCIFGTVSIASDLTIKIERDQTVEGEQNAKVRLAGYAGPALVLNGHTLTLSDGVRLEAQNQIYSGMQESKDSCVIEGGTIVGQGNVEIQITDYTTAAAVQGLTIKDVPDVQITGSTATGGVVEHLTLVNCGAEILQRESSNTTIVEEGQITTDRLVSLGTLKRQEPPPFSDEITQTGLMTTDGEIWAYGGALTPYGPHFIETDVTTPTAYRAGEGWALYTPGDDDTGTPAKLTLDGASYNGTINIQQAKSVQLELKGTNEVKSVNTAALTLTGNGSFEGKLETGAFTNSSTAALNAVVIVSVPGEGTGTAEFVSQTVYGNRKTSDINVSGVGVLETTALTIAAGAALTVDDMAPLVIYDFGNLTNKGTIVNEEDIQILLTEKPQGTPDFGTVVNNGVVTIYPVPAVDITGEEMSAFIKGLGLTGTGTVTVEKTVSGSGPVTENYTHSGTKLLDPAGDGDGKLDLRDAAPTEEENAESWAKYGYKWEVLETDPDNTSTITKAKLTLAPGFNAEKVVLPDATVEIETQGESTIGTLTPPELAPGNAHADKTNLTLSGAGPLTITEHVEISGGAGNIITVDAGAKVTADNGISIGASGGIDSTITVNGTLTAAQGEGTSAIYGGRVEIGNTGVLEVSGENGVQLNGMTDNFDNLFTVTGNGRFTANCSEYNIRVNVSNVNSLPKDENGEPNVKAVINLGTEYMPDDCEPQLNANKTGIDLIRKSTGEVYTGALTIHKNHKWAEEDDWTDGGGGYHWHACLFAGCTAKKEGGEGLPHYYAHGADACRDCGHTRPAGTPDSEHSHVWSPDWTASETHHWHECTAGNCPVTDNIGKNGYGEHVYDGDRDAECNVCGGLRSLPSPGPSEPSDSDRESSREGASHAVTVEKAERGKVKSNRARAESGSAVTLTVTPDSGCRLETLTVTDSRGSRVTLTERGGGKYVFTMPDRSVTVRAVFAPLGCDGGTGCPSRAFSDLDTGAWYHGAVDDALETGLMSGYSDGTFRPGGTLSRAMLVQILYNRAGRPAVAGGSVFTDVDSGAWYAPAVTWAAERGIVDGYAGGAFGPGRSITREQLAVMLWRYAGSPAAGQALNFIDADKAGGYAVDALRWAVENGVMNGRGGGVLDPLGPANRAQAAQMLKNYLANS